MGGHSHTYIDEPAVENGIVVLQAGMENTHLGRFDFWYDEDKHMIDHWKWEMIPVEERNNRNKDRSMSGLFLYSHIMIPYM
ncbi:MAG: hypothetical protein IJH90_10170 [Mogibacterium sp.]|nr:hypothetical protein [Mogibacterium sp.]